MNTNHPTEIEAVRTEDPTGNSFLHVFSLLRYGNGEDRAAALSQLLSDPAPLREALSRGCFPDKEAADLLMRAIGKRLREAKAKGEDADVTHLTDIRLLLRAYVTGSIHPIL